LKINEGEIVPLSSSDFFFKNKNEELRLVDLNSSYVFCGTELGHIYKFTINQGVLNNPRLIFSAEEKVNSDCDTISNYRVTQIEVLNHNSIGVVANYFYEIDFFGQILQRDASILDGYSTKSPFNTFSKDGIDRFFVGTQSYYNDSVNIQFLSNEIRLLEKEVLPQGNYPISLPVQIGFRKWLMPGFYDFSSIVKFDGSNIVREDVLFSPMRGTSCMNNYYYDKETQYIYVLIGDTEGGLKVWRKQVNMEEYINLGQLKGNKYDFVLENVYFGANSSELSDYSFSTLDLLAKELKRNTGVNIKLCGHTSRVPNNDPIERMWLSKRRVMRIKEYLVNNCNVSKKRIEIEGFGDTRLLDDKHPKSEKNRRVSIFLF
jgi:outer membrane protein OmpA-like peptidoglycan-associated protein